MEALQARLEGRSMIPRWSLVGLLLIFSRFAASAQTQSPQVLAEGTYGVADSMTHSEKGLHWKMVRTPDGGFLVTSTPLGDAKPVDVIQEFGLSSTWKPTSYSIKVTRKGFGELVISLSCRYLSNSINCDSFDKGKTTRASLPIRGPSIFLPPGFATDMFWIMATICAQADRTTGKLTTITEVGVADNPDSSILNLESEEPFPITYVGLEDLKTVLGIFRAHKFTNQDMTIWTTEKGLVLAMKLGNTEDDKPIELISLEDNTHELLPPSHPSSPPAKPADGAASPRLR